MCFDSLENLGKPEIKLFLVFDCLQNLNFFIDIYSCLPLFLIILNEFFPIFSDIKYCF